MDQQRDKDKAKKHDKAVLAERTTAMRDTIREDMEQYHTSKQSVRASDMYYPYDLQWAQTMSYFVHPCLLNNYPHAIGLARMLYALNLGLTQFDMAAPLPSAADYPAMNQPQWNPYVPSSVRNPYPIRCVTQDPQRSTHAEFELARNQVADGESDPMVVTVDGEDSGLDCSHRVLRAYLNRNAVLIENRDDIMEDVGGASPRPSPPPVPLLDPSVSLMQYTMEYETEQVQRAIPLTIAEAWNEIQAALGPAPVFPSDMPLPINVDWVRRANEFGRYFLIVFRPWTSRRPEERGGADSWGEFVHFLRFLSSNASSEPLHMSLSFLAAHPLNVVAVCRPDLMILEDHVQVEGDDGNAVEMQMEEDENEIKLEETHADLESSMMEEESAKLGGYAFLDDDAVNSRASPLSTHNISDSIPAENMKNLERMASTLGITLPSGYKSILCQWNLIQECLKLSGAPPHCLASLCYQAQWSRNMLVESFVHLPWLLQRDVADRLCDPAKAFSIASHALDRLYGVCRPHCIQRPMTEDGVLDVDLILEEHDSLVASAALYLQCTAHSNEKIETSIFGIKTSDSNEWYCPSHIDDGLFMMFSQFLPFIPVTFGAVMIHPFNSHNNKKRISFYFHPPEKH